MPAITTEKILADLCDADPDILLAMLISEDGLPLHHVGHAENVDVSGALCTELHLICSRVLSELMMGSPEHIFVRARAGCVDIWPVEGRGMLACMTRPGINPARLQALVWRAVTAMVKEH